MTVVNDVHSGVGAFVVDALDPEERAEFEAHLASCSSCRQEVAEFDATAAELSRMVAAPPPAALRELVLAGIQQVRPTPPTATPDRSGRAVDFTAIRPAAPGGRSRIRTPNWERPDPVDRRQWRRTRILTAAVAATLVVALGLGGWVYSLAQQQQTLAAREQLAAVNAQRERSLLSAPDARVVTQQSNGAQYSFVVSKQRNEALFLGTDLADPGAGRRYQLWTVTTDPSPTPDALVTGYGRTQTWMTGSVRDAAAFAVSVEPAAGSLTPTEGQIRAIVKL